MKGVKVMTCLYITIPSSSFWTLAILPDSLVKGLQIARVSFAHRRRLNEGVADIPPKIVIGFSELRQPSKSSEKTAKSPAQYEDSFAMDLPASGAGEFLLAALHQTKFKSFLPR